VEFAPRAVRPSDAPGPSLREQLEGASPAARALLPIRFFFGVTFVYAGLDKILDPSFFDASSPASIVAQLAAFARTSPLAFAIKPVEPYALPVGLLIAIAEIAIGLGALTGLAYRLAAAGGAALSLLFFLTASWSTRPYYYGADLPYAFGWLALLIAGHGGLLVPRFVREMGLPQRDELPWGALALQEAPSPSRRLVVQAGVLGGAALALAAVALPVRFLRSRDDVQAADLSTGDGTANPAGAANPATATAGAPSASVAASPTPGGPTSAPHATSTTSFTPSGLTVATTAQVDQHGAVRIRVPVNAPSSLPAGDPALIVKLTNGSYACYDAVCTHQGCRVGWDAQDKVMLCPCHGAAFDPNNHAAVLQGPTDQPLLQLPISIDPKSGAITLTA
jgi:thiosulfate dehydrogenase [quinone] large subunit